jgi:undecaprenyl-diphosphatase
LNIFVEAVFLGLVEGTTEFLPISSTGHLILAGDLLGFKGPPGRVFEVVIQLGAILAVCVIYWQRLWTMARNAASDAVAQRFWVAILVAFLPAAIMGLLLHGIIKTYLFNPWTVSAALIAGGVAIIAIERMAKHVHYTAIEAVPIARIVGIGLCQTIAMFPGVSRSGATIMGGLLLGLDRKTAAEFSFILAIPTMLGATSLDLWKNSAALSLNDAGVLATGFTAAFLAALITVRLAIAFVSRVGFEPFGYYRILMGTLMLMLLASQAPPG